MGNTTPTEGDATKWVSKVFSAMPIITTTNILANAGGITGNGNNAQDFYSNSTYIYFDGTDSHATEFKVMTQTTGSVWQNNTTFKNGFYQGGVYYYLVKDSLAYLPDIPMELTVNQSAYLVMEYLGTDNLNNNKYNHTPIIISDWSDLGVWTSGTVTQKSTKLNTFALFGTNGLFVLNYPPVNSLNNLRIKVTSSNNNVVQVIPSTYAAGYQVQIMGNGTAVLNIISVLNAEANVAVQICVINGFANFTLVSTDNINAYKEGTDTANPSINLKKGYAQEFSVNLYDINGNAVSAGAVQAGFDVKDYDDSCISVTTQPDSFVIKNTTTNDCTANINKIIKASFYQDTSALSATVTKSVTTAMITHDIKTTTGPTAVRLNQNGVDIYAGGYVNTSIEIDCDDEFINDVLYIWRDGRIYAKIVKEDTGEGVKTTLYYANLQEGVYTYSTAIKDEHGDYIRDIIIEVVNSNFTNGVQTFDIEYRLSNPASITQTVEYELEFEARPITEEDKGDVLGSYVLHIEPQTITALDMYHYTDVIEEVETGNLTQAGKRPSNTIVAGGYGLLKVTIDPYYVDFYKVELTSSVVKGVSVAFNQRVYDEANDVYVNLQNANIEVLSNGIATYKNGFKDVFAGTLYFRTYIPQDVEPNASFTINVNVYDKNNNIIKTASKLYSIYASSALSISYDNSRNAEGDEVNAYIAQNTGGLQDGDIYGQNTNIVSIFVEAGLIDPTFNIINYQGSASADKKPTLVEVESSKNVKLKTSDKDINKQYYIVTNGASIGDSFAIELSAKTYIAGILQTIKRTMTFKVVDIVINYKWNTPNDSEILQLALNGDVSRGIAAIGGAISNVVNGNWVFTYSNQPIQITQFVSDLRSNRSLLNENVDTLTEISQDIKRKLRNIPEFSFDVNDLATVKNVVAYLQYINQYKLGDDKYVSTFMYKQQNNYLGITSTTSFDDITFMVGQGTEEIKNYYIQAQSATAKPQLKSNFYVNYNADGILNNHLTIKTDGAGLYYNYEFGLYYEENTSKDHPIPVRTLEDLNKMEAGKDYILLQDIDLNEGNKPFAPITTQIASFDGNNHRLTLHGDTPFVIDNSSSVLGVFNTVASDTILKNVIVEIEDNIKINCINEESSGMGYTIGLLAGVNNGAITNCKVVSKTTLRNTVTLLSSSTSNSVVNFGGLVGSNQGYITNSNVQNVNFNTKFAVFGGLVSANNNVISASYVNDIEVNNTADDSQTPALTAVAGFVTINSGVIVESYVGGIENEDNNDITETMAKNADNRSVKITSNSDFAAFVFNNSGSVVDSFANATLDNATTTIVSGFVYTNSGTILRAYTASAPSNNENTYSRPFIGTTFNIQTNKETINNTGTLTNCYFYSGVYNDYQQGFTVIEEDGKVVKLAIGMTAEVMSTPSLASKWNGYSFASAKDTATGVWNPVSQKTLGPTLINANIPGMAEGVHQVIDRVETVSGNSALYYYTLKNKDKPQTNYTYNSKDCVALIYDAQSFNQMFNNASGLNASNKNYYARIIKPIDLSPLTINNINLTTTTSILRGTIMGNNMTISGVDISYFDTSVNASLTGSFKEVVEQENPTGAIAKPTTSELSIGLFGEIRGGTVASVSIDLKGVYAETQARMFVGGLAGRVVDGTIYNLNITGNDATVLGRHLVGGVAGGVFGKSRISNINAGVSVTSAYVDSNIAEIYNHDILRMSGLDAGNPIKNLSVAGGLFGVVDLFDYISTRTGIEYEQKISESNTTKFYSNSLNFTGNGTIVGQTVGGVIGVVGCNTVLTNAATTVLNNTHLRASVFAGGLVGQNNGTITYSKVEYAASTQNDVNLANTGDVADGANATVFNAINYTGAVGGLVGANFGQNYTNDGQTGVIRYANSSIYVDAPNAQNVGGLVGIVFGGDIRAVYASGYAVGVTSGNIGGLIGTVSEIDDTTNANIMPLANMSDNLLVKVKNPYNNEDAEIYPQTLLLDFAVAQTNWASSYYNYYANVQKYGYLGGLVGYATEQTLLTTSHNSENYKQEGFEENETVVINYYSNIITRNPVAVNANITENMGLKLNAFNIEINPVKEDSSLKTEEEIAAELTQKTVYLGQGDTRNAAYNPTTWDWFKLWDSYSISGRNADNTPILKQGFVDTEQKIRDTTDFLKVYWHPDGKYTLENDIYFTKEYVVNEQVIEKQIKYIMVGTVNLPFSGEFDGQGHTIYGLSVSNYLGNIGGLFGCVAGKEIVENDVTKVVNAVIKDVTLDGVEVSNVTYVRNENNVITDRIINNKYTQTIGGLAGRAENADINNVVILNLKLDTIAENTNTNTSRYIGGLIGKAEAVNIVNCGVVGVNALRTNEEVEQGLYNGIKVLQQNTTLAGTQDELYVGGLIGKANVVKINKDEKIATLMTSANTDINMQNVYSNTYLGAGIGWADCVDANVFIIGGENKISGVITNGTKFIAGGYYGVLSGSDEENPNALYTGYAYSTIRSTLQNEGTAIIKLAYDFNLIENVLEYSEADEKPTTIINLEVSSIIASDKTLSQAELLNAFNAYEDNAEKTIDAKLRSYNATSIVSTGMDAALNVGSYYKTEEGRYKTGDDGVVQLLRNIPLDPYYSLVVSEDNYDITNDDLKTAAIVYPEILDFTKPVAEGKYGNSFGYVPGETTKITQQTNLLNSVFGKISKLYYIDRYGVQYGLAVVLTSGMSGDTFAQDNNDVYYILTRDVRLNKMSGQNYVFNNISGILNGHGHSVILTDATTLANNVSGILTGAKVQILTGTVNNESFKISGSFGFIANTLSEGGVVNACGSYAVQSTTTTAQDVETLTIKFDDTTADQNMFGGVVGVNNNGVVNNCWSHISYVINNEDYAAFGGIVGASNGGVLSNLNYYGDIIGVVAKQDGIALTTGGILGTATASTDIYMVLSFIFAYSGTYHITKDQNIRLHEKPSDDIDVNTNTAVYFNISPTSDGNTLNPGVGEFIDFASVFENVDINSPKYRKAFVQYWGIWDKEEDGVNYGLPRLKIEPKVTSKGGRNEDDAIEVPNETIFAGMLQYEKNRAGRFYILTKEEDNGEYYLQDIHDIMNSFYSDATSNYETVNQDDNYYGHLLGNNKKLVWRSSDIAPKPLFNVFATSNTLYSGTTVIPYIKDLTLVNNSTYIPNLIANISQATISYVKFLGDSSKHLTITDPNGCYGAFVGENQGRIENCIIKDLNINIAGTCGGKTCIGGLAGKHSPLSTIPISNTSLLNCNIVFDSQFNPNDKEIYVGGVVGYNTSKIKAGSSSTTKVKSSSFVYFLTDTYVYYYTAANNVVEYDPETLAAISAPTNIAKCTTKFYKAGTYVRYKDEAEILLLGGEYQIYTILNYCKAHFNTSYNGFAVSDERLEARTGGADTEFTERSEFVVTEGQYTVYPYLDANLYSTGGLVRLWQDAVVDLGNNETWSYDEITISNNYRYVPKNDANFANWVLKSGTISIYDPKYIERRTDLIPIKLESNSSETAKFYYVYRDSGNYVLNYVSTNGEYNTGETEIWLIVLEGSLKNISAMSSSNGEVYYIADSIWLEAKTQQSYYAGDESLTADGNIVQVNIDTKNKINYVGGITGYNNKGSIEKMLLVGVLNGYDYVGGITGYNNGEIIGSNITDVTINAHQYVGGIAGQNGGTIDNVTIKDATISATSSTSYAGGIAGSNQNEPYSQARITNGKLQSVKVNGSNNTAIITGYNNAEITISNSKGLVINKSTLNVSSVDYDVNNVEDTMEIGLVTSYNEGIINFSASGSNMEISYDPDNSVITYINFTQKANWADYNYDYTLNVGGIAGINKGVINSPSLIGSGINLEPQFTSAGKKIINFGGIAGINYLNASIRSVRAVKLDMESSFGTAPNPVNNNQVSDQLYLGGIAAINNGYISGGVGSVASKIEAPKACALGGVVAHNAGVVHNAYFNGTIKAQDYVGGIAGTNAGVIMASRYSGSIEAQDYVGGIAGVNYAGALVASVSISGTIKAQDYVGGIAGVNDGELSGANQVSIEDNQETALKLNTNDHVVFNGATIETDGINNATTSGVNTGVNSTYTITAEEGSTFTAFITKNTIQTISGGNVRINVLTEGASWINGESESSGNSITLTDGNTIKFNCDALLEYIKVDNNVTIKFTGGDIYLKNSNKIKIATDGSAAIDGYMKMGGDDINITVRGGSFYTTSDSNVTVVSNTTTAKLDGVAQFKQNDTVSVSSNSAQMYLNDTTSIINGSVTHSANTSVVMGDDQNSTTEILPQNAEVTYTQGTILNISVPRANPEKVGDDYYVKGEIYSTTGTNTIYMKYEKTADSYREAGYYKQDKTTRVYPKYENDQWDWFTDPECTQQDPSLNGRFYYVPDDSFRIGIKGKVKLGPNSRYENLLLGSYQLTTINETIQNPSATEEQKTTDILFKPVYSGNISTQIDNNGYLTTSEFQTLTLKETIIYYHYYVETQENGSYSYTEVNTIDINHRGNAEHMLNIMVYCDQDTTIRYTYAKGTTVQVKGKQQYINETTSTYKNSIVKHFASTEIKLNGEDSVVSENFVTPTLIIYKPQSDIFTNVQECVVTMPNHQQFVFCGTQTFDTKTMINVSGRITVEEGGITEGANPIAEGSSTYDCDGPITLEANTKISSGTIGTSYQGQVDDKTYIITNNNTNITYNADSFVRYNQDTTSTINGTVIYPDGNLQVMYTLDSIATYPKDAQLIFKAGTTIYPSINFEFELFNSTKISVSDYDEDDVMHPGKIERHQQGGSSTEYTLSQNIVLNANDIIKVLSTNTQLTFEEDTSIKIISEETCNTIKYLSNSQVNYTQGIEVKYNNATVTQPSTYNVMGADNYGMPIVYTFKVGAIQNYGGVCNPTIYGLNNNPANINIQNATIVASGGAEFSYLGEVQSTDTDGLVTNSSNSISIYGKNFVGGAVGALTSNGTMENVELNNVDIYALGGNFVGGVVGSAIGEVNIEQLDKYQYVSYNGNTYRLNIANCSVRNVFIHYTGEADNKEYASYTGGFAGDLTSCYIYNSGVIDNLYIQGGYTIGGYAGSVGGGGNQGYYTMDFIITWGEGTVGGDNAKKDVIFESCFLRDMKYNTGSAELFSNTDNPNGDFLNSWTSYEGGTSVWDAAGSVVRDITGGTQSADERNLSAVIGQIAVKDSYYDTKGGITVSGRINVNNPR